MVAPSEKLKPCRLDKSQEQLLERIKVAYAEKGQHLHSKVFDLLDDAYASLSEGLSAMVSEDRRTLARVRNLSADVDKPLSESYTYRRSDREPRDKQMVGTAAERVRREMTETAEFLEQSLKELDAAKAEEEEALSKVLMGPGDEERDKEFHRKMSELKQEAAALKRETLRKLAVVEEEFEEEKREILEELWLQS